MKENVTQTNVVNVLFCVPFSLVETRRKFSRNNYCDYRLKKFQVLPE